MSISPTQVCFALAGILTVSLASSASAQPASSSAARTVGRCTSTSLATPPVPYPIGAVPFGFSWPTRPTFGRTVDVRTAAEFNAAAAGPGTFIRVRASFPEQIHIAASNVCVEVASGVTLGLLSIEKGTRRIAVYGGRLVGVRIAHPTTYWPPPERSRPEWLVEDVLLDGLTVANPSVAVQDGVALDLRGKRVAVVRANVQAHTYAVWSDAVPYRSEDLIFAGNVFRSAGSEATVRLVSAQRTLLVENTLQNGAKSDLVSKHNYRVHGRSNLNFAARNLLMYAGVYFGTMDGDALGRFWFNQNTMRQLRESLFEPSRTTVPYVQAVGNRIFSDRHRELLYGPSPSSWDIRANTFAPYADP